MNCENCRSVAVPPTRKKFCSRRCKHQAACRAFRERRSKGPKCGVCGKPATHGRGLYCSDLCRIRAARAAYTSRQRKKQRARA